MLVKISKNDLLKAKEVIKEKIKDYEKFTHFKSAITTCAIFLKRKNFTINFLGKPFGFYGFVAAYLYIKNLYTDKTIPISSLEETKGVVTSDIIKDIFFDIAIENLDILEDYDDYDEFGKYLIKIIFVSPTLFSTLNVAIAYAEEKKDENFTVFLPDSYIDSGEFWEGLNYLKSNKINNLEILIDFNSTTKQNKLPYLAKELDEILTKFYKNIIIYDTTEIHNLSI